MGNYRVIFLTVVLDVLAIGVIIPALPSRIRILVDGDIAQAATIFGLFGALWAVMQFAFAPGMGALSDHFGRRPVILLSNLVLLGAYGMMALAPGLGLLLAGRVLSGVAAGNFASASAYIADITPPGTRAAGFSVLGAAFGIGFGVGPALGGPLGAIDPHLPFWVSAGLVLVNLGVGFFLLPESLPAEGRIRFSLRRATPVNALGLLLSRRDLMVPALVAVLSFLAIDAVPSTLVLYSAYRFGWNEAAAGLTLSAMGLGIACVQGILLPRMVAQAGESRTAQIGIGLGAAGFFLYALAAAPWLLWVATPLIALCGLIGPTMQSRMTRAVDGSRQGELQGAFHSLHGVSNMISPLIFTNVFAAAIGPSAPPFVAGAPFFLAALLLLAALLPVRRLTAGAQQAARRFD